MLTIDSISIPVVSAIIPDRYTEATLELIAQSERAAKDSALAVATDCDTVIVSEANEEYKTLNALVHLQLRKIDLDIAKKTDLINEALNVLTMHPTDPGYDELRLAALFNLRGEIDAICMRRQLEKTI